MKARPYSDGCWSALPSGALVWFEGGLPLRVRWEETTRAGDRVADIRLDLATITGQRWRLSAPMPIGTGGFEAQVLP